MGSADCLCKRVKEPQAPAIARAGGRTCTAGNRPSSDPPSLCEVRTQAQRDEGNLSAWRRDLIPRLSGLFTLLYSCLQECGLKEVGHSGREVPKGALKAFYNVH